jgi:cytochrome oxidase Cu insertion factor (SCO1/SenC/PrrC family)
VLAVSGWRQRYGVAGPVMIMLGAVVIVVTVVVVARGQRSAGAAATATAVSGLPNGSSTNPGVPGPLDGLVGDAVWAPDAHLAPLVTLTANGQPFTLAAHRGRVLLVTFLDSRCRTLCPIEGRELATVERPLPARQRPLLVIISIDPLGDTPASIRSAAARWGLVSPWVWLTGSRQQLAAAWRAFGVYVRLIGIGNVIHDSLLYLIDRGGAERVGMLFPFSPPALTRDLRRLASEPHANA